jgi:hypothetical protein
LEAKLESGFEKDDVDITEFTLLLHEARDKVSRIRKTLRRKTEALGVDERLDLRKLTNDLFLRLRMNARALKKRIRDRLRQRKFELERLERAYRASVNGMHLHHEVLPQACLTIYRKKASWPNTRSHQAQGTRHSAAGQNV